jgi:EmrB/QacA subfamily drug resistance transporter
LSRAANREPLSMNRELQTELTQTRPGESIDPAARTEIIVGVLLAMFLAALDQTIVAPALPTIGSSLGNTEYLSWIVTAYLLTATAVTPLYGKLADIRGRRPVIFGAIGIFVAGSIISALAPSMLVLVIGRAIQGIGGGGLGALAMTVIGDVVAPRERGQYQGYISGMWGIASLAGPVVGGFLTHKLHWPMIFWINLPLAAFAIAVLNNPLKKLPPVRSRHRLDLPGASLVVLATTSLMLVLTWGGSRYPWISLPILGLTAVSLVFWLLFGLRIRHCDEPILPTEVLKNPIVATASASNFFSMGVNLGLSVYIPLYLQGVRHLDPSSAGLSLVPLMGSMVCGAAFSGWMTTRLKHYKRVALIGVTTAALALFLLAVWAGSLPYLGLEAVLVVAGAGIGTSFPLVIISVQNAVDPAHLGVATGAVTFLRALGGAMGVAVLGAVFLGYGLAQNAEAANSLSDLGPQSGAAFAAIFLTAGIGLVITAVFLVLMEEKPLRGKSEK